MAARSAELRAATHIAGTPMSSTRTSASNSLINHEPTEPHTVDRWRADNAPPVMPAPPGSCHALHASCYLVKPMDFSGFVEVVKGLRRFLPVH